MENTALLDLRLVEVSPAEIPDLLTRLWELVSTPEFSAYRSYFDSIVSDVAKMCGVSVWEIMDAIVSPDTPPPAFQSQK